MKIGECFVDGRQRTSLEERLERDSAGEHQFQNGRIVLRNTTPVALCGGVEGHQVGESELDLGRVVPDHRQIATRTQ
jgi:hypothetical protein